MAMSVSYCGLVCDTCPIYAATREQDTAKQARMRTEIAAMCAKYYGVNCEAKDVNDCDGCRSGERQFFGCKDCRVRDCASAKGVETCAHCSEYACTELQAFFTKDPSARARLDDIRSRLHAS